MRLACLSRPIKTEGYEPGEPEMADVGKLLEAMTKGGVPVVVDGSLLRVMNARLRLSRDKFTITDGPFTETKEVWLGVGRGKSGG